MSSPLSVELGILAYKSAHLIGMLVCNLFQVHVFLQLLFGQHRCVAGQFFGDFLPLLGHLVHSFLAGVLAPSLLRLLPSLCLPSLATSLFAPNPCFNLLPHRLSPCFSLVCQLLGNFLDCLRPADF